MARIVGPVKMKIDLTVKRLSNYPGVEQVVVCHGDKVIFLLAIINESSKGEIVEKYNKVRKVFDEHPDADSMVYTIQGPRVDLSEITDDAVRRICDS